MADNEYNDEYQFADLDSMGSDHIGDEEPIAGGEEELERRQPRPGKNILRNALIAVILIVLVMLGYKFFGSYWAHRKAAEDTIVPSITTTTQQAPPPVEAPPVQAVQPVQIAPVTQPTVDNSQVTQKLSDLEISEQNVRSEINSVNSQLGGINSNVNDLSEKIASLNRIISVLASKVDQQSTQIAILTERTKPKPPPVRPVVTKPITLPIYYIQAVIPGRAWLIAPNGSTLTVREGTQITGYGVIKLIDPNQGRILTTSGRVIRFSQQDS
ncbi:type IVB secretion system protein IcmG/DotF [Legionella sp.]|uniref:type IVB secretion system protein IcmG/DotF n=1 Tax=Legionella sp. TaxID=459 RepID=UPI000CA86DD1|nr:type IVB secretion system protein IcmG/DotF [Legionella sp.]PJE17815.1 MAG: type IV secretion protein IcmG [Legionella sp.]